MEKSNLVNRWPLYIIRGLIYILIGARLLLTIPPLTSQLVQLIGGLLLAAGSCGCAYAVFALRADRNYFWELLRSVFDIGFGIAFLLFSQREVDQTLETFGLWAILYAFLQAVQAMYIFMLSGVKQPRTIFGNVLYFLTILLAGGLAYESMSSADKTIPFTLIGLFIVALGIIITVQAIQQRHTLLINNPA